MTISFAPGTPCWVGLEAPDIIAASNFYCELFGWTAKHLTLRIRTWRKAHADTDTGRNPGIVDLYKNGKLAATIAPANEGHTYWLVVFATDDADASTAKVKSAGGKVIMEPTEIVDWGRRADFEDPTGASFRVWQPGQRAGVDLTGAVGSLSWIELLTTDVAAAKTFYGGALGVSNRDIDIPDGGTFTLLNVGDTSVADVISIGPEHRPPTSHWSVYFAVDDCDAVVDKALGLGGTESLREDTPAGRLAFLTDPQGATFGIVTPNPNGTVIREFRTRSR